MIDALADPIVTANLYCHGDLDGALRDVVVPLVQEISADSRDAYVWTIRYRRRGQHLKIRVHGCELDRRELVEGLSSRARRFFFGLDPVASPQRSPSLDAPAIDPEDEPDDLHPDRTLLWTTYRRSPVSLGGGPLLVDDAYCRRMTECLGYGCELVLHPIGRGSGHGPSPGALRTLLLKALVTGLPAVGCTEPWAAVTYLRYHRDWLLRFFLVDEAAAIQAVDGFDRQLELMESTVSGLRRIGLDVVPPGDTRMGSWVDSLVRLTSYLSPRRFNPELKTDRFAPDAAHPAWFKVFHGLANQAGIGPLEEAFVHHLLITALDTEHSDPMTSVKGTVA